MERGTIYWDESSHGKNGSHADTDKRRGRWVGERRENGRRVRFRSTDYDKVLAWIQHGAIDNTDIRQLVGMKYKVNIRTGDVIGCGGKILTPHSRGGCTYTLSKRGKHHSVTHNRIMYAAIHNIDVLKMPTDIVVSKTNEGDTVLTPFLGIGSEVHEAVKLGRFGIGFELKESYFNEAIKNCKKMSMSKRQTELFAS